MSKTTAFAYLRVSGRSQIKGDGFPRQRETVRAYAREHGIRIVKVFEEKGVGGATEWEDRPAWAEMVGALNGVKVVIIERLDRLARELFIQEYILRDLKQRGVTLVSVHEQDIDSNPERILFRQIMGAIAQYDKTMVVLKLRGARQRMKTATGRCEGRKPFGAKPGEAAVRDRIRSMREAGSTLQSICDALNSEGRPTRCGGRWMPMTVRNIARR
jgi:DNA invertase Pin-like site-specific DNA recombinase